MVLRVSVVGAGSWGTTLAALISANAPTTLWARRAEVAEEIAGRRTNATYLPGVALPAGFEVTSSLQDAVRDADVVVMAVPSHGFRATLAEAAPHLRRPIPVVSVAKGLERGSGLRMTEVVAEVLPAHPAGVLTGPNLAREILDGQPAASVLALADEQVAVALQQVFHRPTFRVYTNLDIAGCETAGVVKNVIAIAAGMVEGMGFGDNTKATVMTRGLAELSRLGVALGGDPRTFAGLAGMGDLVATCASDQSRNRRVGVELGRGRALEDVLGATPMVAEGVMSSAAVCQLAAAHRIEVPICAQVHAVCHEGASVSDAVRALLSRAPTSE